MLPNKTIGRRRQFTNVGGGGVESMMGSGTTRMRRYVRVEEMDKGKDGSRIEAHLW